jgi:hypothetical protein
MKYATLAFAMLLLTPLRGVAAADPPVQVKLSDDRLVMGEHVKIHVRTAADGYLLVLRVDTQGTIRVLFPVDPTDTTAIRAGHSLEIRGRGNRQAFTVDDTTGSGMVLAARADTPFWFVGFTTGDHWDVAALARDGATTDPEITLLSIVDQMTDGHYDYDAVSYTVGTWRLRTEVAVWYGPYLGGYGVWPLEPDYYYGPRIEFGISVVPAFHFHRRQWLNR